MARRASVSRQIARRSKSNLAFALSTLAPQRRRDMTTFYAFCRVVDDIADDSDLPVDERRAMLNEWKHGLQRGFVSPDELQAEVSELPARYSIRREWLCEIIDGVASDLDHQRYQSIQQLLGYCYKVASVVGLVSIEIFGYQNAGCKNYAVQLGYALQLTNIIRDVGEDARNAGRIYLPQEDLQRFGVSENQILEGRYSTEFRELMDFQHQRALHYYNQACRALPEEDRCNMMPAEMMAQVYSEILEKIHRNDFRVLDQRFGLGKMRKLTILAAFAVRGWMRAV